MALARLVLQTIHPFGGKALSPFEAVRAVQSAACADLFQRQAWVALAQDVKGLEKALKDQTRWYDEFYRNLAKQKMGPEQQAQSDMQAAMKLKEEALQAYQQKDDKTAQEKIRQARDMMAEVAKSGPESMKGQALSMMGEIKAVDDMVVVTMRDGAKALNEQAKSQIEPLNPVIESVWKAKMEENAAALNRFTDPLNAQRQAQPTPQGQPKEAEAGVPGLTGESGAPRDAQGIPITERPFWSLTPEQRLSRLEYERGGTGGGESMVSPSDLRASGITAGMDRMIDGIVNAGEAIVGGVSDKTKQVADAVKSPAPESGLGEEAQGVFAGFLDSLGKLTGSVGKAADGLPSGLQINVTVNGGTETVSWG